MTPEVEKHTRSSKRSIIPTHDRELWVRIGMAIKSALGEAGFDLWDHWSRRDQSYKSADARSVWQSIQADGRITFATLYHEAKQYGLRPIPITYY